MEGLTFEIEDLRSFLAILKEYVDFKRISGQYFFFFLTSERLKRKRALVLGNIYYSVILFFLAKWMVRSRIELW